jgi:hypothetical protein
MRKARCFRVEILFSKKRSESGIREYSGDIRMHGAHEWHLHGEFPKNGPYDFPEERMISPVPVSARMPIIARFGTCLQNFSCLSRTPRHFPHAVHGDLSSNEPLSRSAGEKKGMDCHALLP